MIKFELFGAAGQRQMFLMLFLILFEMLKWYVAAVLVFVNDWVERTVKYVAAEANLQPATNGILHTNRNPWQMFEFQLLLLQRSHDHLHVGSATY